METKTSAAMGRKPFLFVTAFFSGMSVMAIELGASRLLAPYFSSSQVVWTVIIGTIMIAMAIGNVWGGRAADRNPDPARLYRRLLVTAVWTALIPFAGKYIIAGITGLLALFVTSNFLVAASFLSCIALFVFPLMMLGTVTPSLVKYTSLSLEDNGKTVGELGALNTIGSILGTFLPTFVTIPTVGTARTFLIFAAILALISLAFFVMQRKKSVITAGIALVLTVSVFVPFSYSFAFWESDLAYEDESIYNYLQVKEDDRSVILSTNVAFGVQSIKMKTDELTGLYYEYALAAPLMAKNPDDILILGLGTGTYAELCLEYFPGCRIEGVEIDAKIIAASRDYFDLPEEVIAIEGDGRAYLDRAGTYDIIHADAYQDITIPFQMASVEFFTMMKEHLNEGGVAIINMNMRSGDDGSINEYLCDTVASVFPYVYTVVVPTATNALMFATEDPEALSRFEAALAEMDEADGLTRVMRRVASDIQVVEGGEHILTDDRAPVEVLSMRALDGIIQNELAWVRDILKEQGISGLINLLQ